MPLPFSSTTLPFGLAELLGRKYAIQQQQADAQTTQAGAAKTAAESGAKLDLARADLLPGQINAEIALSNARRGLLGEQAKFFGPTAEAGIFETTQRGKLFGAQAGKTGAETRGIRQLNKLFAPTGAAGSDPVRYGQNRFLPTLVPDEEEEPTRRRFVR